MKKTNKSQLLYNHLMFYFPLCIIGQLKSHSKHQVIEIITIAKSFDISKWNKYLPTQMIVTKVANRGYI